MAGGEAWERLQHVRLCNEDTGEALRAEELDYPSDEYRQGLLPGDIQGELHDNRLASGSLEDRRGNPPPTMDVATSESTGLASGAMSVEEDTVAEESDWVGLWEDSSPVQYGEAWSVRETLGFASTCCQLGNDKLPVASTSGTASDYPWGGASNPVTGTVQVESIAGSCPLTESLGPQNGNCSSQGWGAGAMDSAGLAPHTAVAAHGSFRGEQGALGIIRGAVKRSGTLVQAQLGAYFGGAFASAGRGKKKAGVEKAQTSILSFFGAKAGGPGAGRSGSASGEHAAGPQGWAERGGAVARGTKTMASTGNPRGSGKASGRGGGAGLSVAVAQGGGKRKWGWGPDSPEARKCPFYKRMPGTPFVVDAFRYGKVPDVTAYFLTHFHSDHYGGLTRSWAHGPIYCTPVTARLVELCLRVDSRWLRPVPLEETRLIAGVEVTFLDANHCPGAALVVFRRPTGEVLLHTGDFRAGSELCSRPALQMLRGVHELYLDTTYCNPRYSFPAQEEALAFAVQLARRSVEMNRRSIIAVGAYSIGKERVFLAIADALGVGVYTDRRRARVLASLEVPGLLERLTGDPRSTPVHVLPLGHINPKKLGEYLQGLRPAFDAIIGLRPTGWTFSQKMALQGTATVLPQLKPGGVNVFGVPYSEHSSFVELRNFVRLVQPSRVIPTVNVGSAGERDRMQGLFKTWLSRGESLATTGFQHQ